MSSPHSVEATRICQIHVHKCMLNQPHNNEEQNLWFSFVHVHVSFTKYTYIITEISLQACKLWWVSVCKIWGILKVIETCGNIGISGIWKRKLIVNLKTKQTYIVSLSSLEFYWLKYCKCGYTSSCCWLSQSKREKMHWNCSAKLSSSKYGVNLPE